MALRSARPLLLLALAVAFAAPATASAQISAPAAAEAREQGFSVREELGPEVSLDQSGPGEGLFRVGARRRRRGDHPRGPTPPRPPASAARRSGQATRSETRCARRATPSTSSTAPPANQASRYPEVVPQVQAIMRRANAVLNSESLESGGGEADYRMRCAADGEIKVDSFTGPAGDDSFGAVVDAATAAGFDEPGTKYTIFYETEATNYCGVGSLYDDERLSADNWNNVDTSYAVTHDAAGTATRRCTRTDTTWAPCNRALPSRPVTACTAIRSAT